MLTSSDSSATDRRGPWVPQVYERAVRTPPDSIAPAMDSESLCAPKVITEKALLAPPSSNVPAVDCSGPLAPELTQVLRSLAVSKATGAGRSQDEVYEELEAATRLGTPRKEPFSHFKEPTTPDAAAAGLPWEAGPRQCTPLERAPRIYTRGRCFELLAWEARNLA